MSTIVIIILFTISYLIVFQELFDENHTLLHIFLFGPTTVLHLFQNAFSQDVSVSIHLSQGDESAQATSPPPSSNTVFISYFLKEEVTTEHKIYVYSNVEFHETGHRVLKSFVQSIKQLTINFM
jgi:hypothetical protein